MLGRVTPNPGVTPDPCLAPGLQFFEEQADVHVDSEGCRDDYAGQECPQTGELGKCEAGSKLPDVLDIHGPLPQVIVPTGQLTSQQTAYRRGQPRARTIRGQRRTGCQTSLKHNVKRFAWKRRPSTSCTQRSGRDRRPASP